MFVMTFSILGQLKGPIISVYYGLDPEQFGSLQNLTNRPFPIMKELILSSQLVPAKFVLLRVGYTYEALAVRVFAVPLNPSESQTKRVY